MSATRTALGASVYASTNGRRAGAQHPTCATPGVRFRVFQIGRVSARLQHSVLKSLHQAGQLRVPSRQSPVEHHIASCIFRYTGSGHSAVILIQSRRHALGIATPCLANIFYSMGAALLDLEKPSRVIARAEPWLLSPQTQYECVGDVPNVVFPCAALTDAATGRIAIYYGCADTVTGLAFCEVGEVVEYVKENQ